MSLFLFFLSLSFSLNEKKMKIENKRIFKTKSPPKVPLLSYFPQNALERQLSNQAEVTRQQMQYMHQMNYYQRLMYESQKRKEIELKYNLRH